MTRKKRNRSQTSSIIRPSRLPANFFTSSSKQLAFIMERRPSHYLFNLPRSSTSTIEFASDSSFLETCKKDYGQRNLKNCMLVFALYGRFLSSLSFSWLRLAFLLLPCWENSQWYGMHYSAIPLLYATFTIILFPANQIQPLANSQISHVYSSFIRSSRTRRSKLDKWFWSIFHLPRVSESRTRKGLGESVAPFVSHNLFSAL